MVIRVSYIFLFLPFISFNSGGVGDVGDADDDDIQFKSFMTLILSSSDLQR